MFPEYIKSGCRKFIRHLDGNSAAGYDPDYLYHMSLFNRDLFIPKPVREQNSYPGYVPPLNSQQIELLISVNDEEDMLKTYQAEIEETAADLQRYFE